MVTGVRVRIAAVGALMVLVAGCASHQSLDAPPAPPPPVAAPQTRETEASPARETFDERYPILIHKTGGFVGVDERYVIWPDGYLEANDVRRDLFVAGHLDEQTLSLLRGRLRVIAADMDERAKTGDDTAHRALSDSFEYTVFCGETVLRGDDATPELASVVHDVEHSITWPAPAPATRP